MTTQAPIIRTAGEGDKQTFLGGGLHTWKLMAEDTGGALFMFEDEMVKGKTTPLHTHPTDEISYLLEGEILSYVDGVETRLTAGSVVYVPRGVEHAFLVLSDTARILAMGSPATSQSFYRGASIPATDDTTDRVDIPRLQASAQENGGVELLGPPPFDLTVVS